MRASAPIAPHAQACVPPLRAFPRSGAIRETGPVAAREKRTGGESTPFRLPSLVYGERCRLQQFLDLSLEGVPVDVADVDIADAAVLADEERGGDGGDPAVGPGG